MGAELTSGPDPDAGFSLIELVVVVAVLSVLAVGASLATFTRDRDPTDQQVFMRIVQRTQALAVEGRQSQGLLLSSRGISRYRNENGQWTRAGVERRWRGRARVTTALPQQGPDGPNVILLSNGVISAFRLTLRSGPRAEFECVSQGAGVTCN